MEVPDMPYRVEPAPSKRHIRITVNVAMTRKVAADAGEEAAALGRKMGVKRFLYDVRSAPNTETVLSNYEFANDELPALGFDRGARVALLVAEDDRSHDFVILAMQNAGFHSVVFSDEAEAVEWLESDRPSTS
jgi:hypothetical protein